MNIAAIIASFLIVSHLLSSVFYCVNDAKCIPQCRIYRITICYCFDSDPTADEPCFSQQWKGWLKSTRILYSRGTKWLESIQPWLRSLLKTWLPKGVELKSLFLECAKIVIEAALSGLSGVIKANVNFATERATVHKSALFASSDSLYHLRRRRRKPSLKRPRPCPHPSAGAVWEDAVKFLAGDATGHFAIGFALGLDL